MKCFFWFLLFLLPASLFARLGEREAELTARFGPPLSRAKETTAQHGRVVEFGVRLNYRQGDWFITCVIVDGRSAREFYNKGDEWTEDQFTTVLAANSQGARWTDISKPSTLKLAREWRRADGATASWQKIQGMDVIQPAYVRARNLAEAKAKAEASRIPKI
ncbi:MAG: hypothetical protein JSS11_07030 [Verrucomicrobia bacterium]|nr:hypothetical protein [Verrucomicrobiota bacterium]